MIRVQSVLIADEIEQNCIDILKADGIKAIKKTKLTKDQLITELRQHDAVIVRSATKVSNIFIYLYIELFNNVLLIFGFFF